jgi:Ca-activated chloride channel family protein
MNYTFANPWLLLLLLLVPPLIWWRQQHRWAASLRFASVAPLMQFAPSPWLRLRRGLVVLRGVALVCLVVAFARPQKPLSEEKAVTEGIDIVLCLDVSGSMLAEDFEKDGHRKNRVTVVKDVVRDFITKRTNDRLAMIAFAGRPYTVCPLTLDHDWLIEGLDRMRVGLIEDGTAIGSALGSSVNRLRDIKAKSRVVVLLTDGCNNAGKLAPDVAADAARALGIKVYTIGVGAGGIAPMPVVDPAGRTLGYRMMQADLDEPLLKRMAEKTRGQYFRAADTRQLQQIYETIDKLEKRKIEAPSYRQMRELFPWFAWPGLALLLVEVGLGQTRLRKLP